MAEIVDFRQSRCDDSTSNSRATPVLGTRQGAQSASAANAG